MSHVFISYAHVDGDFAEVLIKQIDNSGFKSWIDSEQLRAGEDWRQAIDDGIRDSFALIVIMTPEAKASEFVTYEWACGWGAGVKVIPIMLKPTKMHPRLEALQYLDFTNRNSRPWDKLIERLAEIDKAFSPNTIHISRNTPPAVQRAIEALDSHSPTERKAAIESLAQTRHDEAYNALIAATTHPIRDVRIEAATKLIALEGFHDATALPALIEAYPNAALHHRVAILNMITRHQYKDGMSAVLEGLKERSATQQASFKALEQMIDERAIPDLLSMVRQNNDHITLMEAEKLILGLGEQAVPRLLEIIELQDDNNDAAHQMIWRIGAKGIPILENVLYDANRKKSFKESILHILRQSQLPEARAVLEKWQREQDQK